MSKCNIHRNLMKTQSDFLNNNNASNKLIAPMGTSLLFCQKQILEKMAIFSSRHKSINKWCYAYDEVDLGLILDMVKYLHWETKWLINSMIGEDFSEF